MQGKQEFDEISDEEEYQFILDHIIDLSVLNKELNENTIAQFENYWQEYLKTHRNDFVFWRGAKTLVVDFKGAKSNPKWKSLLEDMPGYDEPCATRYPYLMSSLIWRILKKIGPYVSANKYPFITNIANNCHYLEQKFKDLDKLYLCKFIINEQIKLLTIWSEELLDIIHNVNKDKNLLDKGWVKYFAFGRNVNANAMLSKRRCPNAKLLGPAVLNYYKFIIDERGYASVKKSKNDKVFGVLWIISPEDNKRLDLREGVKINIYRKENLKVETVVGFDEIEAMVYISNSDEGFFAKDGYIEEIVEGLKKQKVPIDDFNIYLQHIRRTKH